ncbi:hypothetical protein ACQY0O_001796 [Thecaphora frezii]
MASQQQHAIWQRPCSRTGFSRTDLDEDEDMDCAAAVSLALAEVRRARNALDAAELALLSVHPHAASTGALEPDSPTKAHGNQSRSPLRMGARSPIGFDHDDDAPIGDPWRRPHAALVHRNEAAGPGFALRSPTFGHLPSPKDSAEHRSRLVARASLRELLHSIDEDARLSPSSARDSTGSSTSSGDSAISINLPHSPSRPLRVSQLEQIVEEEGTDGNCDGEYGGYGYALRKSVHGDAATGPFGSAEADPQTCRHDPAGDPDYLAPQTPLKGRGHAAGFSPASMGITPDSTLALSELIGIQLAKDISDSRKTEPMGSLLSDEHNRPLFDESADSWPSPDEDSGTSESDSEQNDSEIADQSVQATVGDTSRSDRSPGGSAIAAARRTYRDGSSCPIEWMDTAGENLQQARSSLQTDTATTEAASGKDENPDNGATRHPSERSSGSSTLNELIDEDAARTTSAPLIKPKPKEPLPSPQDINDEAADRDRPIGKSASDGSVEGASSPVATATTLHRRMKRIENDKSLTELRQSPQSSSSLVTLGDWSVDSQMFMHPRQAPRPPPCRTSAEGSSPSGCDLGSQDASAARLRQLARGHLRTSSDLGLPGRVCAGSKGSFAPPPDNARIRNLVGTRLWLGRLSNGSSSGTEPTHRRSKTLDGPFEISHPLAPSSKAGQLLFRKRSPQDAGRSPELPLQSPESLQSSTSNSPSARSHPVPDGRGSRNLNLTSRFFTWKSKARAAHEFADVPSGESSSIASAAPAGHRTDQIISGLATSPIQLADVKGNLPSNPQPGNARSGSTAALELHRRPGRSSQDRAAVAAAAAATVNDGPHRDSTHSLDEARSSTLLPSWLQGGGDGGSGGGTGKLQRVSSLNGASSSSSSGSSRRQQHESSRHVRGADRQPLRGQSHDVAYLTTKPAGDDQRRHARLAEATRIAVHEGSPDAPSSVSGSERGSALGHPYRNGAFGP